MQGYVNHDHTLMSNDSTNAFTPKDQREPNLSEIVVQTQPHFDEGYRKLLRSLFENGKSLRTPLPIYILNMNSARRNEVWKHQSVASQSCLVDTIRLFLADTLSH